MSHQAVKGETCLTKLRHMSHQAEKGGRDTSNMERTKDIYRPNHYFEASKPVCMVAMYYNLPFMISKCLLQSHTMQGWLKDRSQ